MDLLDVKKLVSASLAVLRLIVSTEWPWKRKQSISLQSISATPNADFTDETLATLMKRNGIFKLFNEETYTFQAIK